MKNIQRRLIALVLAITAAVGLVSGCGGKKNAVVGETKYGDRYPLKAEETLSWFTWWNAHSDYANYKDQPLYKYLMKNTGVNIDFRLDQTKENFNLMLASNDLADIILYKWQKLPEGIDHYIDTGVVLDITDVIDAWMPNYKKYLEDHPEVDKAVKTDDGRYWGIPFVRETDWLTVFSGPIIRKDLLDKYSLEVPETIDEWENALKTFKKNGVSTPLSATNLNYFMYAYGITETYYLDNGEVKYGPYDKRYKDFLERMNKWYNDGLLDPDYGVVDNSVLSGKMTSGIAAATTGNAGSGIGVWMSAAGRNNPDYKLIGTKYPVLNKGDYPEFGQKDELVSSDVMTVISGRCKDVELAAKLLDYGFSKEGILFYNFGVEGESYEMKDGAPTYTDTITKYTNGDITSSLSRYIATTTNAPTVQAENMYRQRLIFKEQSDAIDAWSQTNMKDHIVPAITLTEDETEAVSSKITDIDTYVKEESLKFILGKQPLSEFDGYINTLKDKGIEDVIAVKQAAVGRYKNR